MDQTRSLNTLRRTGMDTESLESRPGWVSSKIIKDPVSISFFEDLQRSSFHQFPFLTMSQIKHDQTAKEKKIQLGSILNSNVYRTMSQWSLHHGGHSFTIPRQPQLTGPSTMKGASHLGCFSNLTQHQPTAQWKEHLQQPYIACLGI